MIFDLLYVINLFLKVPFLPIDVLDIMTMVIPYLESEPMLIDDVPFDITIVADLHGQVLSRNYGSLAGYCSWGKACNLGGYASFF